MTESSSIGAAPQAGPWDFDKYGDVVDANGRTIRVTGFALTNSAEAKANSRLICAAPTMLAALEEALDFLVDWEDLSGGPAARKARAAIQRATGEQK